MSCIAIFYRHGHGNGYGLGRRDVNDSGLRQRKPVVDDIPEDDGSEAAQVLRLLSGA